MKQEEDKFTGLPENAFRELKPGEVYNPLMSPKKTYPEVNLWSVASVSYTHLTLPTTSRV